MRTFFILISLALIIAALCGAALSWDGSAYLFQILDKQAPFTPNDRLINIPLHIPVLLVSRWTNNLAILRFVFGLIYVAIPAAVLALSWWIVRRDVRSLFVWPALGIGLGMLPGQFFFVSEANIATQLFWPLALAILTRLQLWQIPIVAVLAIAIFFSHPSAILLFALAAVLSFLVGMRYRSDRRKMWLGAFVFSVITASAVVRFLLVRSQYESDKLSWDILRWTFDVSMAGVPIKALAGLFLATAVIFGAPVIKNHHAQRSVLALYALELICFTGAAGLLVYWALNPPWWQWAGRFTFWAPFVTCWFMGMAALECLAPGLSKGQQQGERDWQHRVRTIQITGSIFCLVLSVQSLVWRNLTSQLRQTMVQNPWSCISMSSVAWLDRTAFNHFATPHLSLLLQGQTPQKVLLSNDGCTQQTFQEGIWLDSYGERAWQGGWFELQTLGQRLRAEVEAPDGCMFMLTSGWHRTEGNESYWWRWSDGRDAQIRVLLDRDTSLVLHGAVESFERPNQVDVFLNNTKAATLEITRYGMRGFDPVSLQLHQGQNLIQFISHNSPVESDNRELAINIGGVTLISEDGTWSCRLHP